MRKFFTIFLLCLTLCVAGCGAATQTETDQAADNPIAGKLYMLNTIQSDFEFTFMIFHDDNTFRGLHGGEVSSGTYTLDENALTISYSDETLSGAVIDDGDSIQFGDIELIDYTEKTDDDDPIWDQLQ